MALAARLKTQEHRVFCIMSDGECDEGSVWEALLFAYHHQLGQPRGSDRLQQDSEP